MTIRLWCKRNQKNIYSVGLVGFLLIGLFFWGDFPIEGIRNISNSYITINTAILAVAFAAIVLKQGTDHKFKLPEDYYSAISMTSVGMFASIYSLYLSYVPAITKQTNLIVFAMATGFTFFTVINWVFLMREFEPKK
jgi:hypothetical protein